MKVFNLAGILLGTILCSKGIANPEVSENTAAPISIKEPPIRTMNPYTPFAVKDGINLWLSGEALYMKATEDGLEYAFQDAQHVPLTPRGPVLYIPYD